MDPSPQVAGRRPEGERPPSRVWLTTLAGGAHRSVKGTKVATPDGPLTGDVIQSFFTGDKRQLWTGVRWPLSVVIR
jgi:hypothetical protein